MAAQHRLQPQLYARQRGNAAIPQAIRDGWRAAHRRTAQEALVRQVELAETTALLEGAGFAPIALKGAWLSRHAYAEAAQRPMRDLDLLLTPQTVLPAFDLLLSSGYRLAFEPEMALADFVTLDKHMPVLIAPRGSQIELHHRLWEPDGRLDYASPQGSEAAVRARAIRLGAITFPAPQDMLVHLIVHAVYSHRLDCGPLVLADMHVLLAAAEIDWPGFWQRAQREGWRDGARFMLELAGLFPGTSGRIAFPPGGAPPPAALIAAAPDLLLQDLETRSSARAMAAAIKDGPSAIIQRLRGRRSTSDGASAIRLMTSEGGYLRWLWSRLHRTLGAFTQREIRRQSRELARLSSWLGGQPTR